MIVSILLFTTVGYFQIFRNSNNEKNVIYWNMNQPVF